MMDTQFSEFTPDITPIMLAAHTNNYEIIKLLVQKRVTIPRPHQIRCNCVECVSSSEVDSLRHSRSRLNIYKALASPSLIALSSEDPILTAFRLGWELKELSKVENEFKAEYEELSQQCKLFAKDLLDQARSSRELEIILNHRDDHSEELDPQKYHDLAKLKVAIKYHQKEVSWALLCFQETLCPPESSIAEWELVFFYHLILSPTNGSIGLKKKKKSRFIYLKYTQPLHIFFMDREVGENTDHLICWWKSTHSFQKCLFSTVLGVCDTENRHWPYLHEAYKLVVDIK